jgi:hypothetical protein
MIGTKQQHVVDVAEIIPDLLRLYAIAKRATLYQQSMARELTRAQHKRNSANDRIKALYKQLKLTRAEAKEVQLLIGAMKRKSNRVLTQSPRLSPMMAPGSSSSSGGSSSSDASSPRSQGSGSSGMSPRNMAMMAGGRRGGDPRKSIRMRYFKSLNLSVNRAPKPAEPDDDKLFEAAATADKEWRHISELLDDLEEAQQARAAASLAAAARHRDSNGSGSQKSFFVNDEGLFKHGLARLPSMQVAGEMKTVAAGAAAGAGGGTVSNGSSSATVFTATVPGAQHGAPPKTIQVTASAVPSLPSSSLLHNPHLLGNSSNSSSGGVGGSKKTPSPTKAAGGMRRNKSSHAISSQIARLSLDDDDDT